MKSVFIVSLFTLLFSIVSIEAVPLGEAVSRALTNNPEAAAAEYATAAAIDDIYAAEAAFLPTASLTGSAGPQLRDRSTDGITSTGDWLFTREAAVTVRQLIFDGGVTKNQILSVKDRAEAAKYGEKQIRETIAIATVEAYLNILRSEQLIDAALRNVAAHREAERKAQQRADVGGERSDLALVQGRSGLAKSVLEDRRASLKQAEIQYQRFVGAAPSHLSMPPRPGGVPKSLEAIDTSGNWTVLAAAEIAKARDHEWQSLRAQYFPRVDFEGRGSVGEDLQGIRGEDNAAAFLARISWDAIDFSRRPAIRAAAARVDQSVALISQAELEAFQTAGESWAQLLGARSQLGSLSEYKRELGGVLGDYEEQFKVGKRSFLNLLDLRNEQFRAESALIDAIYQERIAEYRILAVSGRLAAMFSSEK
ncbi:MAG: TolC family protein [Verrucomicrobiota bacterium]